jgi:RNA polymerase sigma-70 factor, ECF subfamily
VSEPDLIRRARAGDAAAWEQLITTHQEAVFRLAYLMLGDPAEAEDAAQEALIRASRALTRFDESRPLRPWLLKIVSNQARNRRRAAGRYVAAIRRALLAEPEPAIHPAAEHDTLSDARDLWAAVRRLEPRDQEIVYLRYFLEIPVTETAETLGVPEGTVKSRLSRALARLRDVIVREFPALREDAPA